MDQILAKVFFGIFSTAIIGGGIYIFFVKNILYALYAVMAVLLSVAGIFILAAADFVGVSQLMIYVGGILVLLLFGIMLGAVHKKSEALMVKNVNNLWSILLSILLFSVLVVLINKLTFIEDFVPLLDRNTVSEIGFSFMTQHLLILEGLGILLLLALIGSTFLASKND
ncbi:NADH dehydrogenase subunit J [Spirosomataceae bacterium TFI 002]|nr:NADH dehydrogenase subunit J [Spirosomataceae bacterium TFI 002]